MSHATITARLQTWMADDDAEFTSSINDIIALGEQRVAKELNCDAMRVLVTGTIAQNDTTITKADEVVAVRWIEIEVSATERRLLSLRQDSWIRDRYPDPTATGTPAVFGFHDVDTIMFRPKADDDYPYEMMTEQRVVGLDADTETWLSTRHDDLLFYACQIESGAFAKDSDAEKRAMAYYERALSSAREEVVRGRMSANSVNR